MLCGSSSGRGGRLLLQRNIATQALAPGAPGVAKDGVSDENSNDSSSDDDDDDGD